MEDAVISIGHGPDGSVHASINIKNPDINSPATKQIIGLMVFLLTHGFSISEAA